MPAFLFCPDVLFSGGGGGGGGSAPSAPTSLNATAGDSQVSLTWSGSAGASNYIVKRGTSSGSYPTTLSSSVTLTNYTDSTAVNGTHYYYVVYATNASGTSAASNEDDATPAAAGGLVSITNQSVSQVGSALAQRAGYRLNTSGIVESLRLTTYATLETWKVSGSTSAYVAYVTISGDALGTGSSATSTEVAITGSPEWYINTSTLGLSKTCTLTVEIRNASTHAVLDTATITLYVERA